MADFSRRQSSGNYATTVDVWVRENDGETVQHLCVTVLTDEPRSPVFTEREAMEIAAAQVRDEGGWGGVFAATARPTQSPSPSSNVSA